MIAPLLLMLAVDPPPPASIDGLPIGGLARQELPAKGCAAYLFTTGATRAFIAMAGADPAMLRIALDNATADYPRKAQDGDTSFGFARTSEYQAGDVTATLDISIVARSNIRDGAAIPEGTLRIDRAGKDSIVIPVAGLIGCA